MTATTTNDPRAMRPGRPHRPVRRLTLALAVWQGLLGSWAYLTPFTFWRDFPFPRSGWLTTLGSFDGHITRDLGLAWIGMSIVAVWAARRGPIEAVRVTLGALAATGALHLAYHLTTLDRFGVVDAAGQLVALSALVVLPAWLWRLAGPERSTQTSMRSTQ